MAGFPTLQNFAAGATPNWEISSSPVASDGTILPLASLAQAMAYNGSNQLLTITVVFNSKTYVQTYTYTSNNLTGISVFVKQ
jgi:hypothetical protein